LHHVGLVVRDIEAEIEEFAKSILASWDGRIYHDPLQKVRVTFLHTLNETDPLIELVEPATEDSPVQQFLTKGGGLHHLCYEVTDLDLHLRKMQVAGAVLVKAPLPAVAFENRRIAWVGTKQRLLLELLESDKT
jgi:methylmalonyl-CoA/ethylmalonyl-CoA epimerase